MNGIPVRIEQLLRDGNPPRCRMSTFLQSGSETVITQPGSPNETIIRSETGKGITIIFVTPDPLKIDLPASRPSTPEVVAVKEYKELLAEIRARVFEALDQHEKGPEHQGQPCWSERCNFIAFMCHSLGLNLEHFSVIAEVLESYGHDHHKREDDDVLDAEEVGSDA
jgi:hypothetical protein